MTEEAQIQKELAKNQMDKIVSEVELENAKKLYAEELLRESELYDIAKHLSASPQKYKKSLHMKMKQWYSNLKIRILRVFGCN